MLPDEVEHMDKAQCLALISGCRPLMLYKMIPEELPGFESMELVKISDYAPHWKEKDAQYQKSAMLPRYYTPPAVPLSDLSKPLSPPAVKPSAADQLQMPAAAGETYHYELPQHKIPASEERIGNMRRYTAQEVLAQARHKSTQNTGEIPPRKKG